MTEIMIVLVVIGILAAILLPNAFHGLPDENVMKFKKANSTLYKVIEELVNSNKYYKDGDLGLKADGTLLDKSHEGDITYFCNTLADILSTKSVNCSELQTSNGYLVAGTKGWASRGEIVTNETIEGLKPIFDGHCKEYSVSVGEEIVTTDGLYIFRQVRNILLE